MSSTTLTSWRRVACATAALALTCPLAPALSQEPPPTLRYPRIDVGVAQLEQRRAAQVAAAGDLAVAHGFRFTDRLPASGITFVHRVTPDSSTDFKLVHYDHGNGLAVADVDGDELPDLYFVNQIGGNELWRNLGGGRFENWTARSGVALADRVSVGASFADVDNDGDPDLFVTSVRDGNVLFRNDGGGRFTDVTKDSGLGYSGHSSGAVFVDFDRDGLLDLFVANVGVYTVPQRDPRGYYPGLPDAFHGHLHPERSERSLLYRNRGNLRFEEVGEAMGLMDLGWSGDATFSDFDGDGWPDLYVLNMQGDDHLWLNREGKRFVESTAAYFPKTSWGAMGVELFDHDNDGRLDLLVTDMHSDMSDEVGPALETMKSVIRWDPAHMQGGENNVFGNSFYRNTGAPPFAEMSDALGLENYWPWGLSVGDLNADGWEDVFITASMSFPYRYALNSLLLNERGRVFRPAELVLGVEPRRDGATHVPWMRLDCLAPQVASHEILAGVCGGHKGSLDVEGTLGSRSSALFDLDGDGDLDIVTSEFHAAPQVLVSDLARGALPHLLVELVGTRSNRDGLGAIVRVHAGGEVLTQQHDGKSGYLSQSSLPLYFGLGTRKLERLEVSWPSGATQVVTDLPASGRVTVSEPPAKPES